MKKRFFAVLTAAVMMATSTVAFASEVTTVADLDGLEGDGEVGYVDTTPVYNVVTLPTNAKLDFQVDPQGLLSIGEGESKTLDDLTGKGEIVPGENSGAVITNESSVPVKVTVKMYVTSGIEGLTLVDALDDVEVAPEGENKETNMLLAAIPGAAKIGDIADYTASTVGIPITGDKEADATEFSFFLDKAEWAITNNAGTPEYGIVVEEDNYDAVSFTMGGKVNSQADWSAFTDEGSLSVSAVFVVEDIEDGDAADENYDAHGLMTVATTVEIIPATPAAPKVGFTDAGGTATSSKKYQLSKTSMPTTLKIGFAFPEGVTTVTSLKTDGGTAMVLNTDYTVQADGITLTSARLTKLKSQTVGDKPWVLIVGGVTYTLNIEIVS